jgi:hypothetical protein
VQVYLEIGKKRTWAGALEWPGWCRSGRDEASALQALLDYAPRYARVLRGTQLAFEPPADVSAFVVAERLAGTATSDFGAPDIAPVADRQPFNEADLPRFQALLQACWAALDEAVKAAGDKELRKGPRGGGRDVEGIIEHVQGAEASYVSRLAWKLPPSETLPADEARAITRQGALDALANAARGNMPERGPRGGALWTPRYFVRRSAWHVLDHAWEIEDRIIS